MRGGNEREEKEVEREERMRDGEKGENERRGRE